VIDAEAIVCDDSRLGAFGALNPASIWAWNGASPRALSVGQRRAPAFDTPQSPGDLRRRGFFCARRLVLCPASSLLHGFQRIREKEKSAARQRAAGSER
jgi:hypothetical protein